MRFGGQDFFYLLIFAFLCMSLSCAGSKSQGTEVVGSGSKEVIAQFKDVDESLVKLEEDISVLKSEHQKFKEDVVRRGVGEGEVFSSEESGLVLRVKHTDLLLMNDKAMTRNEFSHFLETSKKNLCQPEPKLHLDSTANYELVIWILESFYSYGCVGVKIIR